ncbi:MAG: hypothetical protein ACK4PI_01160 [Tepidisphaerales bacterium]
METESKLAEVLGRAERELADLAAQCLSTGDFAGVQQVVGVIQRLRALMPPGTGRPLTAPAEGEKRVAAGVEPRATSPAGGPASTGGTQAEADRHVRGQASDDAVTGADDDDGSAELQAGQAGIPPRKKVVRGKEYPRFYRDRDDMLVKVGYSKSSRREYEHRAPKDVLDKVVAVALELGSGERLFTSEALLAHKPSGLAEVPPYQSYLCLAFLLHHGFLVRVGRSRYALAAGREFGFRDAVARAVGTLPLR